MTGTSHSATYRIRNKPVQEVNILKSLFLVPQACRGKMFMINLLMKERGSGHKMLRKVHLYGHPNDDDTLYPPCVVESCWILVCEKIFFDLNSPDWELFTYFTVVWASCLWWEGNRLIWKSIWHFTFGSYLPQKDLGLLKRGQELSKEGTKVSQPAVCNGVSKTSEKYFETSQKCGAY